MFVHLDAGATLFSLIHSLLEEQESLVTVERRKGDRHAYTCSQLMAPYDGWTLPKQADFRLMPCQDISPTGFSFLSQERPEYEHLVIALGTVPFKFFSAQVMHVKFADSSAAGLYVVGCRFLHRLSE